MSAGYGFLLWIGLLVLQVILHSGGGLSRLTLLVLWDCVWSSSLDRAHPWMGDDFEGVGYAHVVLL